MTHPIDGISLVPQLRGAKSLDREALYWHYPHYSNQGGFPSGADDSGFGTIVHEFQHLINASRRLYENDAVEFEDVWLNEGLATYMESAWFDGDRVRLGRINRGRLLQLRLVETDPQRRFLTRRDLRREPEAEAQVHKLAFFDTLTGLPNR